MATYAGILWAHDGTQWVRANRQHVFGADATAYQEPYELFASDGTDWYGCWPEEAALPGPGPVSNLRASGISNSQFTVQWDPPASGTPGWYRVQAAGFDSVVPNTTMTMTYSGLTAATAYPVTVYAVNQFGRSDAQTITVTTGQVAPPSISTWTPQTYNTVQITATGATPITLRCVSGARNGATWGWATGPQTMGGLTGTEYWQLENAGGASSRFYTVAGTPSQAGVAGSINNTYNAPTAAFGRGSCTPIDWGVPAMSTHGSFSEAWMTDGSQDPMSRWQTGNYPRGWLQFQIGVESGYRVRRFFFANGPVTQTVCPVYTVDGYSWKRWSNGFGIWGPWDSGGADPGNVSPNGLLSISTDGHWDRDWNWTLGSAQGFWTPYIPENGTDLSQRWIYVRWGIVHLSGAAGASCVEVALEYQTPSTPPVAEVLCSIGWG